jgi:6-phosphogluconolactonase/glucosamine-6-phosphate isomerase/deaminase
MKNVPHMNARRMTLTFLGLHAARCVWMLGAGSDKKPVLDRRAAGAALPIGRVRPEGELLWGLARSAAGLPPE